MLEVLNLPKEKGLDGSSVFAIDKLWNIGNETSFPAQTIELNLTGYNFLIIETMSQISPGRTIDRRYTILRNEIGLTQNIMNVWGVQSSNGLYRMTRKVYIVENGLRFDRGYYQTSEGESNACVPINIYGIKLPITDLSQ